MMEIMALAALACSECKNKLKTPDLGHVIMLEELLLHHSLRQCGTWKKKNNPSRVTRESL